jgi:threonine/homoserine/homoserine lactone efflux protein
MFEIIRIFFTGLLISFLGTLPLGTLNVSAMQISVQESTRRAILFALGVALVEIIYVRISLKGMYWVLENQQLFDMLQWVTVFLFLVLAVSCFRVAWKNGSSQKNILLKNKMNRFWLGLTMSAVNPVQIPFWFLWSTYLLSNKLLQPVTLHYNLYISGIAIGTLTALAVFIYAGKWLINKLNASNRVVNIVVGSVFVISAVVQLYRLVCLH